MILIYTNIILKRKIRQFFEKDRTGYHDKERKEYVIDGCHNSGIKHVKWLVKIVGLNNYADNGRDNKHDSVCKMDCRRATWNLFDA